MGEGSNDGMAERADAAGAGSLLPTRRWAQATLLATVFGLGLFTGYGWSEPAGSSSPVVYEAGSLVATGELENVLYDPDPRAREEGPSAGAAFTRGGENCRPFAEGRVRGVACQSEGDWRIVELRQE